MHDQSGNSTIMTQASVIFTFSARVDQYLLLVLFMQPHNMSTSNSKSTNHSISCTKRFKPSWTKVRRSLKAKGELDTQFVSL